MTEKIENDFVYDVLSIYKDDHKYLTDVEYDNNKISCRLKPTEYPYTVETTFDYITSVTATLYACQLTYVLFALMIKNSKFENLNDLTYDEYIKSRDEAKLKFLRYNFKFTQPVKNDTFITASMKFKGVIEKRNKKFYSTTFKIGNGIIGELLSTII
ncbi:MAG: FcoT family thioesterase [Leadbetterella sp.]|nr:FcoT family thioesterase [Leadbetterella sp.]